MVVEHDKTSMNGVLDNTLGAIGFWSEISTRALSLNFQRYPSDLHGQVLSTKSEHIGRSVRCTTDLECHRVSESIELDGVTWAQRSPTAY